MAITNTGTWRLKIAVGGLIAGGAMVLAPVATAFATPVIVGDEVPLKGGGAFINGDGGGGGFLHGKGGGALIHGNAGGAFLTGNAGGEFFQRAREAACNATPMACNPVVSIGVQPPAGAPVGG